MNMTGRWTVCVFAVLFLSSATAWGDPKTDTVTIANGDRITGDINELSRGRLELKTDDVGTIEIEWDKVIRLESTGWFDILTSDGRRVYGHLEHAAADRFILVAFDGESESLPMSEVTNIWPIGTSFWKKLDGSVDAGFSYTRSSGIAQTTMNASTLFRRPAFMVEMTTSATLTQTRGENQRDDRADFDTNYENYRGRLWSVRAGGRVETNESLGLKLRAQAGAGMGLRLINTNRAQIGSGAGLVVNQEQGVDTPATQNIEAAFSFGASYYRYDRPKTNVDTKFQYYPSLSNWGRHRLQLDSSVKREMLKDFFVALNLFDSFDSRPPSPDAARNDVGIVVSLGWSY